MKKGIHLLLCLIVMFSLTGCKKNSDSAALSNNDTATTAPADNSGTDGGSTDSNGTTASSITVESGSTATGTTGIPATGKTPAGNTTPGISGKTNKPAATGTFPTTKPSMTVVDTGKCGANLRWTLFDDGCLEISGTGAMYDYCKGIFYDRDTAFLKNYQTKNGYGGIDSAKHYDPSGQYVAPWYKYRAETDFVTQSNPNGYCSKAEYDKQNPKGYRVTAIVIHPGVTYIGNWAFYRITAPALTIPEGVTELGDWSIRYSVVLRTLQLPSSLKKIGDFGISRNTALTTVSGCKNVTTVGARAFSDDPQLESLSLPHLTTLTYNPRCAVKYTASDQTFNGDVSLRYVDLGKLTGVIGNRMFTGCKALQAVVIPSGVTKIDEYAFCNCTNLQTVTFQSSSHCREIATKAFYLCASLKAVNIPASVQTIGAFAFFGCSALKTVTGMAALRSIEERAFSGCTALAAITFPATLTTMGQCAFSNCISLRTLTLPSNAAFSAIPAGAFGCDLAYMPALAAVNIGSNIKSIGAYAFCNQRALQHVSLPGSVTAIGEFAFLNCRSSHFTALSIPNSVRTIGESAFMSCTALKTITIGTGIQSIGIKAFFNLPSLKAVTVNAPRSAVTVASNAFGTGITVSYK